jgi:predicted ATPase/class 3 adenylate cyclase
MSTLHFLFSDIEGSTRLWEAHPEAMKGALAAHDDQIRKAIETNDGVLFKHTGDGVAAVFGAAADALQAAAAAQRVFQSTAHPDVGTIKVRMAVHSGSAEERDGDYFGPPLNRAARLMSAAHGGQVLASLVTERLAAAMLTDDLSLRPLGEHRLKDLAQPEQVFQLTIEGLDSEFPSLRTPDIVPNNLPVMPTSFVGRDQELAEVEKLIRGARLVTLTGVGGAGKTRLSLQVAAGLGEEYADGVWFVELAAVTDPDMVAAQTADSLGVQEQPGQPIYDTLLQHLSGKAALLVVDNCEHVIGSAADLAEGILQSSPDSRIIATSRELLGVGGEVAYGMRSMSLPRDVSSIGPVELARYDAVQLFLERAAAAKPDFYITSDTAPHVAEICQRLDGMPLAIELAAARLRSFTPQQIADYLDQRFRILTGGARTALPRQQTLAAAIDWSYRLLDEREQLLFERLSMFQGGFDLEAAQQVCAGEALDEFDVFELVPTLVDKSLVNADVGGDAARYRLLETIRQFARDKLDEAGATDTVRRRHAEYFMGLAEEAEPNVRGADEKYWWDRLNTELDNLRLAMEWSIEAGEPELGMRLAAAIWRFWWFTFRFSEGVEWLQRMYDARGEVGGVVLAKTMLGLGTLAGFINDRPRSSAMLTGSIELYRELDRQGIDPELLKYGFSAALINLSATTAEPDQDYEQSTALNEEALEVARRIGDGAGEAVALGNLAEAAARLGDADAAREGYAQGIAASRALNSAHRTVEAIVQAATFEDGIGEPALAAPLLDEAIALAKAGGLTQWEHLAGNYRALMGLDLGEPDARERLDLHSRTLCADPEFRSVPFLHRYVAIARADFDRAAGDMEHAALVLGIIERLAEETSPLDIENRPRRDRVVEAVTAALGEEATALAIETGRSLSTDEALAALAE